MTLPQASLFSSASATEGTRIEDDEGRDPKKEFLKLRRALKELADAAQFHETNGQLPPTCDAKRVRSLLVKVEVGILLEQALSEAACAGGTVHTLEKAADCAAFGPVEVVRGHNGQQSPVPILAFRTDVCNDLLKKYGPFVDTYRAPYLVSIQMKARSVLAGKQT
jgi:hypothetical protein